MTEKSETPARNPIPGIDFVVPTEALKSVGINALLSGLESLDTYDVHRLLTGTVRSGEAPRDAALNLLGLTTNVHFDPQSKTEPFRPIFIMDGRRSLTPSDLHDDQFVPLADFVLTIEHPGLRARIADIVWFQSRARQDMANQAIASYVECIRSLQNSETSMRFDEKSAWSDSAKALAVRAITISAMTGWKLEASAEVKPLIRELTNKAAEDKRLSDFLRIAKVDFEHGISEPIHIAGLADTLVADIGELPPATRIDLAQLAARCFRRVGDNPAHDERVRTAAECHVEMADLAGSAMLAASCLDNSIQLLRNLPGTRERRDELMESLREVQARIHDEMGTISTEVDLTDLARSAQEAVHGRPWPEPFIELMLCDLPPTPEELEKEVNEYADEFPMLGMMPVTVQDHQGRTVFKSAGGAGDDHTHRRYQEARTRDHARQVTVNGVIAPMRLALVYEHPIDVDAIAELLKGSPFIQLGHEFLFARGALHFLAGDNIEAASILVPQLENSLRYLLTLKGIDTTSADENGIQSEASLSVLLNPRNAWRGYLVEILGERYVSELELLFHFAGGPTVRHQIAHGKVPASGFQDHNQVYAIWIILHLAFIPVLPRYVHRDETAAIAPATSEASA